LLRMKRSLFPQPWAINHYALFGLHDIWLWHALPVPYRHQS